jgi:hypothetical protein
MSITLTPCLPTKASQPLSGPLSARDRARRLPRRGSQFQSRAALTGQDASARSGNAPSPLAEPNDDW